MVAVPNHRISEPLALAILLGTFVLVVDDDAVLCRCVARLLAGAGARVLTATGGDEAIAIAGANSIDLVLTDMDMPGLDGPRVAYAVRSIRPHVAVVFMSGRSREEHRAKGRLADDDLLVDKPFAGHALVDTLVTALGSGRV